VSATAVIFNPNRVDPVRLAKAVDSALAAAAMPAPHYFETSAQEPGGSQAAQAIALGCSLILVAGGDGTVRHVAQVVANSQTPIGIIPVGTGNVLARNLAIPLGNMRKAAEKALQGKTHQIDLGRATLTRTDGTADSHVFAVMAGLGLDAQIIMNTDAELKKKIGWVTYIDGGIRSLPVRFEKMLVTVAGRSPKMFKIHSLLIGNCGFLPGNISLMPDAQLDDGLLDVATVGPRKLWNWIDFFNRVTWVNFLRGKLIGAAELADYTANVKTLTNLTGDQILVEPQHAVDAQLDGDGFGKVTSANFEVLPKALKIRL
jgi:diacylglycerol kinase (ATP)